MSLWRSIVGGFGGKVGADLARRGLEELIDGEDDEKKRAELAVEEKAGRNRKVAIVVVGISVLGLLALTGALTAIFQWLLGALFVAGLLGGGWYLVRKKYYALMASRETKKVEAKEKSAADTKQKSLEDQLAALKKKKELER